VIEKLLFALGAVVVFEGFFLAIIPERLKKNPEPNRHNS
jgi:uncharacterized protein YjeT (DUF2065 family)